MPRILSIEDDPDFQKLIEHALQAQGWEIHCAYTGLEGCEMARAVSPDIILLDLMLPILNGVEVLKLLKADEHTRDVPVVIMTAYSLDSRFSQKELTALGAHAYLPKPVKFGEFLPLLQKILFSYGGAARTDKKC